MASNEWIGVDLDRTLCFYDIWRGADHIGEPIPLMVNRIRTWLAEGIEVRIFTARVYSDGSVQRGKEAYKARVAIEKFCMEQFGQILTVTCQKDFQCLEIWDDRAIQIIPNTGRRADGLEG